jgi:hypothetical protein
MSKSSSKGIFPSDETAQVSRFDIRTRLQAGWSGHLHDIRQRTEDGLAHDTVDNAHYSKFFKLDWGPNCYLPCIWPQLGSKIQSFIFLYNPLQLERVGPALTGFIRTIPQAPAGLWFTYAFNLT